MRCNDCGYYFSDHGFRSSAGNIICSHCGVEVIEKAEVQENIVNKEIEAAKAVARAEAVSEVRSAALAGGAGNIKQTSMSAVDQMLSSISLVENAKRRAEASNGGQCKANTHEGIDLAESKNNRGSLVEAARKRAIFAADRQGQSLAEITRV